LQGAIMKWHEQVKAGGFPTCEEVCEDCRDGKHVFHILDQCAQLYAQKSEAEPGKIVIFGYAADELWLTQLMEQIRWAYDG